MDDLVPRPPYPPTPMTDLIVMLIYKCTCIGSGVLSIALGYRLFVLGITAPAGDLSGSAKGATLKVAHAAPGTFFSLFGAAIISATIWKGLEIDTLTAPADKSGGTSEVAARPKTESAAGNTEPALSAFAKKMAEANRRHEEHSTAAETEAPAAPGSVTEADPDSTAQPAPANDSVRPKKVKKAGKKAGAGSDPPPR